MAPLPFFQKFLKILFTIILIIVSFIYIFSQISFNEMIINVSKVNYIWILLCIVPIVLSHWLRAYRWSVFLKPQKENINQVNLFSAVMIGYFFNSFTLRFGELVRPYTLSSNEKIPFSVSTGTILLERILDVIFLFLMFLFTIIFKNEILIKSRDAIDLEKGIITILIFVLFIVVMLFFNKIIDFFRKSVKVVNTTKFPMNYISKISKFIIKFSEGFTSIKSPSLYFRIFTSSILIWVLYVIPNYFVLKSLGYDVIYHLNFFDAIVILVFSGLATTFSPTPGGIGVFHALIANILVLIYSFDKSDAITFALISHFVNYILQIIVGGYFVYRERNIINFASFKAMVKLE